MSRAEEERVRFYLEKWYREIFWEEPMESWEELDENDKRHLKALSGFQIYLLKQSIIELLKPLQRLAERVLEWITNLIKRAR